MIEEAAPSSQLEVGMPIYLQSVDAIRAICADRIYGLRRPQRGDPDDQLPAIMITRTQTTTQKLFCGTDGLWQAEVQVDCFAMGASVFKLAKAVKRALVDFSGMMGETDVDEVTLINEFPVDDPDPGVERVTQVYQIFYAEDLSDDD